MHPPSPSLGQSLVGEGEMGVGGASRRIAGAGVLEKLARHGVEALRPRVEQGRWLRPMVSRRQAADVRKAAVVNGTYGKFSAEGGGWDPSWDSPPKPWIMKPPKLHKRERNREDRISKIDEALKGQDDRYLQILKERHARKEPATHENLLKKVTARRSGVIPRRFRPEEDCS